MRLSCAVVVVLALASTQGCGRRRHDPIVQPALGYLTPSAVAGLKSECGQDVVVERVCRAATDACREPNDISKWRVKDDQAVATWRLSCLDHGGFSFWYDDLHRILGVCAAAPGEDNGHAWRRLIALLTKHVSNDAGRAAYNQSLFYPEAASLNMYSWTRSLESREKLFEHCVSQDLPY